jgi:hypothetical protein
MTTDAGAPGAPRFDVVLRGYDRRQVDEHVARLQRVLARMRADLEVARSQPIPVVPSPSAGFPAPGQQGPPGGRPRPTPRPRPGFPPPGESPDMIGSFTDRMQSILQAAEEEAAEIRNKARAESRAEQEQVRAQLADLTRQRDALLAELTRMRGQLEGLLAAPTARINVPPRDAAPSPGQPSGAAPAGSTQQGGPAQSGSNQSGSNQPGRGPSGAGQPDAARPAAHAAGASSSAGADRAPAPKPRPAPGAPSAPQPGPGPGSGQPPAGSTSGSSSAAPSSSGQAGSGARGSGRPASGAPAPSPKPSPGGERSSIPAADKPAAHRLPTGAYPAVGEQSASMRPRTEPEPEPGDLFRPASGQGARTAAEQQATAPPRSTGSGESSSGDHPTALVPTVPPGKAAEPEAAPRKPGDVEATVKVGAVRPSTSADATVLTSALKPGGGRPDQEDAPADAAEDGPRKDGGAGGGNGSAGGDRSNRSTSASRSG